MGSVTLYTCAVLWEHTGPVSRLQRGPAWAGLNNPKYSLSSDSGKLMPSRDREGVGTIAPPAPEMVTISAVQMLFLPAVSSVSGPEYW